MIAYQTDADGAYVGRVVCDESPLEPGVFLIPRGAVTIEPPDVLPNQIARWLGDGWIVDVLPEPPAPDPEPAVTWDDVRGQRDRLLSLSDWTQLADAPVDAAVWSAYRQALRDVPQDFDSPDLVVWPTPPS